jgi:hypothetical protein
VYPGAEWPVLAGTVVSRKGTPAGRKCRLAILKALGILDLPEALSADKADALIGAYLAWCTRHRPTDVELVGLPPSGLETGQLREGQILHAAKRLLDDTFVVPECLPPTESTPTSDAWREEEPDWNSTEAMTLRFKDFGLVSGNDPENQWLLPGRDYLCETLPPHKPVQFRLSYSRTFPGGRGWTCQPTIRNVLRQAGENVAGHLSSDQPVTLLVRVISETQPGDGDGAASDAAAPSVEEPYSLILLPDEKIELVGPAGPDTLVLTNLRLICVTHDENLRSRVEYHSVPYPLIARFSAEFASDGRGDFNIWLNGSADPIRVRHVDAPTVRGAQRIVAGHVIAALRRTSAAGEPSG